MCASTLGGNDSGHPNEYFFKIFFKFAFFKFFSNFFPKILFLFFCFCQFFFQKFFLHFFVLVWCRARCVSVATVVPGRQALDGRETVEEAGGTAGIVGCAVACTRGAAKP